MSVARRHERTQARRSAVQVLYTGEIQGESPMVLLERGLCQSDDGPLSDYALDLVAGTVEHIDVIDDQLRLTSENWKLERMPIVDRIILRLAVYEMIYESDVPVSVSINEAVELAKDFGGEDDSPRFVNGVLGRIAKRLEAGKPAASASAPAPASASTPAASASTSAPASDKAAASQGEAVC